MKAESVKVSFSYTCPYTGNVVQKEVGFEKLHNQTLMSMYDDCGTGYKLEYWVSDCPECHGRHEVEVYEDRPFGG